MFYLLAMSRKKKGSVVVDTCEKQATSATRTQGNELLEALEQQVAHFSQLSEENIARGFLGQSREALELRDSALQSLALLRAKLVKEGIVEQAPLSPNVVAANSDEGECGIGLDMGRLSGQVASSIESAWSAPVIMDSNIGHKNRTCSIPQYRWLPMPDNDRFATLEVRGDVVKIEVDMAERVVRLKWCDSSFMLTLPVGFCVDASECQIHRRNRADLLTLTILRMSNSLSPDAALAVALGGIDGIGAIDGFFARCDADMLRNHLLAAWHAGQYRPGEVEGKSKVAARARSDVYTYIEANDELVKAFTRRLDRLVLTLSTSVPELQGAKLMRGSPMAAIYAGAGSCYTPHYDATAGNNGRLLTCIMYLNPFWCKEDGAQLRVWPQARGLSREGSCLEFEPFHGRLVAFLCNSRNLHEVCPVAGSGATEPRMAISCWYYDSDTLAAECPADAPKPI